MQIIPQQNSQPKSTTIVSLGIHKPHRLHNITLKNHPPPFSEHAKLVIREPFLCMSSLSSPPLSFISKFLESDFLCFRLCVNPTIVVRVTLEALLGILVHHHDWIMFVRLLFLSPNCPVTRYPDRYTDSDSQIPYF